MPLTLTQAEQRLVADAFRALASPGARRSVSEWLLEANDAASAAVGHGTTVFVAPQRKRTRVQFEVGSPGLDDGMLAHYDHYFPYLVQTGSFARCVRHGVATRREAYGARYDEIVRSAYTHEFIIPCRSFDAITLTAPLVERPQAHDDVVQFVFVSRDPTQAFSEQHEGIARLLYPAFEVGVRVVDLARNACDRLRAAIDASGAACLVVDRNGAICHRTPSLDSLLAREPDREALVSRAEHMARSFWSDTPHARETHVGTRASYSLSATEIGDGHERFCVVIAAADTTREPLAPELQERFGLTPRQAEVALLLAERRSNREIAAALGVSVHTARHHVEHVLEALGVRRVEVARRLRSQ